MTQPQRTAPGLLAASLRIFEISLGEMLWSRRTIFMGLVVGLPVLMALVVRLFNLAGASGVRVNNLAVDGPAIFGLMIWAFFIKFSVPVLGVFYGTSLVADEVEDKTITYLFTRPIAREAVLIGKYLAYLACTIFVVLPSIVLVWILVIPMGGSLGATSSTCLRTLGSWPSDWPSTERCLRMWGPISSGPCSSGWSLFLAGNRRLWLFPGHSSCSPSPITCRAWCPTPCPTTRLPA
jgi:hypothetical protein